LLRYLVNIIDKVSALTLPVFVIQRSVEQVLKLRIAQQQLPQRFRLTPGLEPAINS
jgi:hypothetical protein